MKITKFGHSCVLVETEERVALFDPGVWSKQLDVDELERVDRLIITHEHGDHMDLDVIGRLVAKFPNLHIVCNEAVASKLQEAGVQATYRGTETSCVKSFQAPHEALPTGATPPDNTGYHFQDMFTHPGDSHHFDETKKVLALPVIAPWGSTTDAVKLALRLKPKYVVPIHDVMYKPEARDWMYDMLRGIFEPEGVELICTENGKSQELTL